MQLCRLYFICEKIREETTASYPVQMAQSSANVTQTLQAKPSIFELVAADSLQSTFHPALKRIANVFTDLHSECISDCGISLEFFCYLSIWST